MIPYVLGRMGRILREAITPTKPPPVTLSRTCYVVPVNGTVHRVRRDGACDCGGTQRQPCPALPLVRDFLAGGGPKPLGRHPDTWPRSWTRVPPLCPICDCPTTTDAHLNSRAGPGWRCSLTGCEHFWQVRMEPLRRHRRDHPPAPAYPWRDTSDQERRAWLEAHYHPPRLQSTAPKAVIPSAESKGEPPTMPKYRIFYARQPTFHPSGRFGTPLLTVSALPQSHVHLGEIEADNLGEVWLAMQGENWSPNGEARPLIERLRLNHTSMSVGDVLRDEEGIYWECLDLGWRRIEDDDRENEPCPT